MRAHNLIFYFHPVRSSTKQNCHAGYLDAKLAGYNLKLKDAKDLGRVSNIEEIEAKTQPIYQLAWIIL